MISSTHQNREDAQRHVQNGFIADLKALADHWDEDGGGAAHAQLREVLKRYGYE